jgi:hypothetical protein
MKYIPKDVINNYSLFIMKIRFILSVFVVIAAAFLVIATPVSAQVSNGGDEGAVITPAVDSNTTVGEVSNGNDEGSPITPAVDANTLVGDVSNGDDDAAGVPAVETPSSSNRSSGGGSSRRSSSSATASLSSQLGVTTASCPLITASILKLNGSTDSVNISHLQLFLKNIEKIDVDVTGTFDAKTEAAVSAFQVKYKDSVLAPWGASQPSGIAYITTIKKINEIACKQVMTLSPSDLAIIAAYKAKAVSSVTSTSTDVIPTTTDSEGNVIGLGTSTDQANVAAAADASILKRFGNFLKGLFR